MLKRLKNIFKRKKNTDGLIGYWGTWTPETNESEIKGEMYSLNGKWIPGPEVFDKGTDPTGKEPSWKGGKC